MPDEVTLTSQLLKQGYETADLRRMTRRGEITRIRRGAYAEPTPGDDDRRGRHLRLIRGTVPRCSPDAVLSHMSAALIQELPIWTDQLDRIQLTRDQRGGSKRRRYVEIHGVPLPPADIEIVAGLATTTLARTVLDLGCTLPMRQAVAIGDAARRRGVTPGQLAAQLDAARGRTGIGAARRAIAFLDPRSESPGESVSRVDLSSLGVPPTELQYAVSDERGVFVGRCDFAWPEFRTLGEYDGRGKYGELRRVDQAPEDVLWDEKVREDRLRDLGWQVVRWLWEDLRRPEQLVARLRRAFARGVRTL